MRRAGALGLAGCAALAAILFAAAGPASAADAPAQGRKVFRVCQDPNNLPFSNVAGQGLENKIAELFARDLNMTLDYYSFPQRLAFVRNTLRYKLPNEDNYRCDIMIGVPADFDQVSATKPYYRSTYALVIPKGKGMDDVHSTADFLALGPGKLAGMKIGVFDVSPASQWLARHNLVDEGVPYISMNPDPDHSPGDAVQADLASGKLDAAILWGPMAAHMAKNVHERELMVIPMASEPGVQFDYAMAMGVRYGEPEWKAAIQGELDKRKPEIEAILRDYGVPLLDIGTTPPARR